MTDRPTTCTIALALLLAAAPSAVHAQGPATGPEPKGPVLTDERYRLVTIAGAPLPAVVEKDRNCREEVTKDTLALGPDSLWTLHLGVREVCGDRSEQESETEGGQYSRDGGTIRFHDDGDDDRDWGLGHDVDVDDLKTGTVSSDGVLTVQLEDGKTTLVFRR